MERRTYKDKRNSTRGLLLLLVLIATAYGVKTAATDGALPVKVEAREPAMAGGGPVSTVRVPVPDGQPYRGDLVLVNKAYALRKDAVRDDLVALADREDLLDGFALLDADVRMSEEVVRLFSTMAEAAQGDGVGGFLIASGYRTHEEQDLLYREQGADYALPAGSSEHQLGVALDVGSTAGAMAEAPEGKWLARNAWRFGFVLRYPAHKTEVTGIQYEPWHFRYVGLPHSAVMQERDLVLEEYLALLEERRYLAVTVEGTEYEVAYYPYTPGMSVPVPEGRPYTLSGDNKGGVIVTSVGE